MYILSAKKQAPNTQLSPQKEGRCLMRAMGRSRSRKCDGFGKPGVCGGATTTEPLWRIWASIEDLLHCGDAAAATAKMGARCLESHTHLVFLGKLAIKELNLPLWESTISFRLALKNARRVRGAIDSAHPVCLTFLILVFDPDLEGFQPVGGREDSLAITQSNERHENPMSRPLGLLLFTHWNLQRAEIL